MVSQASPEIKGTGCIILLVPQCKNDTTELSKLTGSGPSSLWKEDSRHYGFVVCHLDWPWPLQWGKGPEDKTGVGQRLLVILACLRPLGLE